MNVQDELFLGLNDATVEQIRDAILQLRKGDHFAAGVNFQRAIRKHVEERRAESKVKNDG